MKGASKQIILKAATSRGSDICAAYDAVDAARQHDEWRWITEGLAGLIGCESSRTVPVLLLKVGLTVYHRFLMKGMWENERQHHRSFPKRARLLARSVSHANRFVFRSGPY